jgi:hypothetical protein
VNAFAKAGHFGKGIEAERSPASWNFEGFLPKDSGKLFEEAFGKT